MSETILIPLFAAVLTIVVGGAFYFLYQLMQSNWSAKADEFRFERAPAINLMKQTAKDAMRAAQVIGDLEEKQDRLTYRLHILGDLADVVVRFSEIAPLQDDRFKGFMTNVVLAATQAILPTQTNTRARLLVFDGERICPYTSYIPEGATAFRGRTFLPGEGAVGLAFQSGQAVIVSDAKTDSLFHGEIVSPYRSVLCVPVPSSGMNPIGVLNVDSPEMNYFEEEDAHVLAHLANLVYVLWAMQYSLVGHRP